METLRHLGHSCPSTFNPRQVFVQSSSSPLVVTKATYDDCHYVDYGYDDYHYVDYGYNDYHYDDYHYDDYGYDDYYY